jgi:hypothetical protein
MGQNGIFGLAYNMFVSVVKVEVKPETDKTDDKTIQ